jgi:hypothetical protein
VELTEDIEMEWLRKIFTRRISQNPFNGKIDDLGGQDELNLDDEDDSTTTFNVERLPSNHCGCIAPPGGRCAEEGCGVLSCVNCHRHCGGTINQVKEGCGRPLCRSHTHYLDWPDGRTLPFCKSCHGKITRSRGWRLVGSILLNPFIEGKGLDRER